jgi:hypothetical protein
LELLRGGHSWKCVFRITQNAHSKMRTAQIASEMIPDLKAKR